MIAHAQDEIYVYIIYEYVDSRNFRTLIKTAKLETQGAV